MDTLKSWLARAQNERFAVPHFNFANTETFKALIEACEQTRCPMMLGTSEGERQFVGLQEAVALVEAVRRSKKLPVFLNADHSRSVKTALQAVDAGYDSVHIDLSTKPFRENVAGTRQVAEYVRQKKLDISVEGEIGYIVTDSSKVYQSAVRVPQESLTRPEEALRFVEQTGVDRLAPAVGTIHGIAANVPKLDFERIKALKEELPGVALVMHGGSGVRDDDFKKAVALGIANVHINTELRVAGVKALRAILQEDPEQTNPYKIGAGVTEAIKAVAIKKIRLFGAVNKF